MGGNSSNIKEIKSEFSDVALRAHNRIRKLHNSPPLTYSKALSHYAQNHALYLSKISNVHRSARFCNGDYLGENIAVCQLPAGVNEFGGEEVTEYWYKEIEEYNFYEDDPPKEMKNKTRNFTQLVWKESLEVGFGTAMKGRRAIVVASYFPTGNVPGQYRANVLPKKQKEKSWSDCFEGCSSD